MKGTYIMLLKIIFSLTSLKNLTRNIENTNYKYIQVGKFKQY